MIDCILIDDEPPALRQFERQLAVHGDQLSIVGRFRRAFDALSEVDRLAAAGKKLPDVAFIDMQMPGLSGLEVCSLLRHRLPGLAVVFVTAHRDFAAEAFAEEALDYLLKPVDPSRLTQTVARLQRNFATKALVAGATATSGGRPAAAEKCVPIVRIRVFGGLSVEGPGGIVHWRSTKTRELFAYLLQYRGGNVSQEQLFDDIYPDCDPARAGQRFYNDVYWIRREFAAVGIQDSYVSIRRRCLQLDASAVESDIDEFERAINVPAGDPAEAETLRQALNRAPGDYFQDTAWQWALVWRERFGIYRQRALCRLADLDLAAGRIDLAENSLLRVLESDPCDESAVVRLIRLYLDSERSVLARRHYKNYRSHLRSEFQIEPSAALKAMIDP